MTTGQRKMNAEAYIEDCQKRREAREHLAFVACLAIAFAGAVFMRVMQ